MAFSPADFEQELVERIKLAQSDQCALIVEGGATKQFLGNQANIFPSPDSATKTISMLPYQGIIEYEPSELVVTVRCGTRLAELETKLAEHGQILPFEPPLFGKNSTLGGVVASGLAGPSRPFRGSVRDNLLGCKILTGNAEILQFGGQVIKNVAGYDVTRLMAGAMGTLGVLLEVSLKVLPKPRSEITLSMTAGNNEAIDIMCARACKPLPLTAMCYDGDSILMRLSGNEEAVDAARNKIAGEELKNAASFWQEINNQSHYFFEDSIVGQIPLWRISLAPATLPLDLRGDTMLDWGGGLRWLKSYDLPDKIRSAVEGEGGHATLFRSGNLAATTPVFHPIERLLQPYQQRLKNAFDPHKILNPNRFHPDTLD